MGPASGDSPKTTDRSSGIFCEKAKSGVFCERAKSGLFREKATSSVFCEKARLHAGSLLHLCKAGSVCMMIIVFRHPSAMVPV